VDSVGVATVEVETGFDTCVVFEVEEETGTVEAGVKSTVGDKDVFSTLVDIEVFKDGESEDVEVISGIEIFDELLILLCINICCNWSFVIQISSRHNFFVCTSPKKTISILLLILPKKSFTNEPKDVDFVISRDEISFNFKSSSLIALIEAASIVVVFTCL